MDLKLKRIDCQAQGVFSSLTDGNRILYTCEHSYQSADGSWGAKITPGTYLCQRGNHTLDGVHWFSTFEVTGIEGHAGILFHSGNTEMDSEGCILLGLGFGTINGMKAVYSSAAAFAAFSSMQAGCDSFTLTVE